MYVYVYKYICVHINAFLYLSFFPSHANRIFKFGLILAIGMPSPCRKAADFLAISYHYIQMNSNTSSIIH